MCGILAVISQDRLMPDRVERLGSALASMRHRGPDDLHHVTLEKAFLGHTRLSIIDLSSGRQPMVSRDGRYIAVFNGEIFNFKELQHELRGHGWTFSTNSDTEVILAAYEEFGKECVSRFNGMFAFVVYDTHTGDTFGARDRYGIKPLFHAQDGRCMIYSSEIKAVYQTGLVPFEPKEEHFNEFLIFGYIAGEETLHRHVKEVKPAHLFTVRDGTMISERYWSPFDREQAESSAIFDRDRVEELEERIRAAARLWTVSDVEVASLLSGGVDSPLMTKFVADEHAGLKTFSAIFPEDPALDESGRIRALIELFHTDGQLVGVSGSYLVKNLGRLVAHCDEPIHDPNYFTLMALCEGIRATSDIKVVLCGEGADEVFGGYARHRTVAEEYAQTGNPEVLLFALNRVALPRLRLFSHDTAIHNGYRQHLIEDLKSSEPINMALELDQQTFLASYLHRQDRVGMLFGLEIRTPYLDHHLTGFANALAANFKINDGCHKWILRKVAERHLPMWLVKNNNKIPFSAPIAGSLAAGELRQIFEATLEEHAVLARTYSIEGVRSLLRDHDPSTDGKDHSNTLWRILTLELWLRSQMHLPWKVKAHVS